MGSRVSRALTAPSTTPATAPAVMGRVPPSARADGEEGSTTARTAWRNPCGVGTVEVCERNLAVSIPGSWELCRRVTGGACRPSGRGESPGGATSGLVRPRRVVTHASVANREAERGEDPPVGVGRVRGHVAGDGAEHGHTECDPSLPAGVATAAATPACAGGILETAVCAMGGLVSANPSPNTA
jgi:hypothetical protein